MEVGPFVLLMVVFGGMALTATGISFGLSGAFTRDAGEERGEPCPECGEYHDQRLHQDDDVDRFLKAAVLLAEAQNTKVGISLDGDPTWVVYPKEEETPPADEAVN